MAVVSNSSPLIALGQIGQLGLLHQLFHEILIPPAVAREAAASVAGQEWIQVHSLAEAVLPEAMRPGLGEGEREALSLAAEMRANAVIVDDDAARRTGLRLGLPVIGTGGAAVSKGARVQPSRQTAPYRAVRGWVLPFARACRPDRETGRGVSR
jgi:predicted nucleic acid-binding protein